MSNLKRSLSIPGYLLHGSITTLKSKCGKFNCACQQDSSALHGPYHIWSGKIDGKSTTRKLTTAMAEECKRRISRYQSVIKTLQTFLYKDITQAPWLEK